MDDSKFLQESKLMHGSNAMRCITLYISFNKRRRLASEGLVNCTGDTPVRQHYAPTRYPLYSMPSPNGTRDACQTDFQGISFQL